MRSPQSLKWALVLHFADAVAGLWYIKATTVFAHNSQLSPQQTAKTGEVVEDPGCQYPCYECSNDHPDLQLHVKQYNCIRVEKDSWMTYKKPNYYPDFQKWFSLSSSIRSCHPISLKNLLQPYERNDFRGRMLEFMSDCPSLQENNSGDILSHHIPKGRFFFFYEQPEFQELQHLLWSGTYRQFSDWGTMTARVGSFQPTLDIS
uniref:Beta/gamma crystallin 'Greek key' domain-containing protein n=1 Tax=Anser cygnoides TaxID=8845 RepID=A0A8B9E2U2_ANSCY